MAQDNIGQKLNHIWEETRQVPVAIEALNKKMERQIIILDEIASLLQELSAKKNKP
jgi:methyl-accepting chemotaxis protein